MNGDAELNQTRRFDFTAKTDRAVISRTRRITASKTAEKHVDGHKMGMWQRGRGGKDFRREWQAGGGGGGGYGGGGSVGYFCQGTLCQGVWYQVTESPKRSREEEHPIDK
ncbi:MAG: hypothetical protein WA703_21920 [Pseudolabrys sp.]